MSAHEVALESNNDGTKNECWVDIGNVTHYINAKKDFIDRDCHIFLGQEHSLPFEERQNKAELCASKNTEWTGHFSHLDPEGETPLGGLFILARKGVTFITPPAKGKDFKKINGKGRVQLYAVEISKDVTLKIYNMYAWSNGAVCKENASRTDDMLRAVFQDNEQQAKGPCLIVGDLNADPVHIESLDEHIKDGTWLDVGDHADKWGSLKGDYTCIAKNCKTPTRRDYVFANREAYQLIEGFVVDHEAGLDVHAVLRIKINVGKCMKVQDVLFKPKNLSTIPLEVLEKRFGKSNIEKRQKNAVRQDQLVQS